MLSQIYELFSKLGVYDKVLLPKSLEYATVKQAAHKQGQKLFGQKVREYRKAKKLSQQKLAHIVNIELSTLNRIELGKAGTSLTTIFALSHALGVEPRTLFEFDILPQNKQ